MEIIEGVDMPLLKRLQTFYRNSSYIRPYVAAKEKGLAITFVTTNPYWYWWDVRGSNPRQTD